MDIASKTIDRHEPLLPEYIQGELSLHKERLYTRLKNQFVFRHCSVGQVKRWAKAKPPHPDPHQKTITRQLLDNARIALDSSLGSMTPCNKDYLYQRGITDSDISRYKMVSTSSLCSFLTTEAITNLSLRISDKFDIRDTRDINGISIPYYYGTDLYGFCTRIIGRYDIKYSISIPQRFCFGLNLDIRDNIIIVEGVFDAIPLINAGYHCMALGDSQPSYWKMIQASKCQNIYLLFDNDYSGKLGAAKSHIVLNEMLMVPEERINIIMPPDPSSDHVKTFIDLGLKESLKYKISLKALAAHLTVLGRDI